MKGFIYIIKNTINNKVYIGQTRTSIDQRWKEHIRHASYGDQIINRAMNKYGVTNFYIEVLECCSIEELDTREVYYIDKFDSTNKSKGYNVSIGGNTPRFKRKPLDIKELKTLYDKGLTLDKISKMMGVTRYIVTTELRNAGVKIRKRFKSQEVFTKIPASLVQEAIDNTPSLRQAAKYAGMKYATFRKACIYNHIEYNSPKSAQHPEKDENVC